VEPRLKRNKQLLGWGTYPDACIGSISEVFDGEPPFTPGGCIARA